VKEATIVRVALDLDLRPAFDSQTKPLDRRSNRGDASNCDELRDDALQDFVSATLLAWPFPLHLDALVLSIWTSMETKAALPVYVIKCLSLM
jgi:hypothetical protein